MPQPQEHRILFVDDEQNVLSAIRRQLHRQFRLETGLGADAGLELIQNAPSPFAVVVTDLRMPGMDGLTFLRKVRQVSPDSICIMLTGFADIEVAVQAVNEGRIFRFLTKPCPPEVLAEALTEALDQYDRIMSMSGFTYTSFVEDGRVIWTERSQGCLAVTGYAAQDFVKDNFLWLYMILPEYRTAVKEQIERVVAGQEVGPMEYKIRTRDGRIRWVRDTLIPQRDDKGVITRCEGLMEDITDRREMEDALKQSEARYQHMVANVPGLVYQFRLRTDGRMEFVFLSDRCRDMFGLEPDQIRDDAAQLLDRFTPEDRAEIYRLMAESAQELSPWEWYASGAFCGQKRYFRSMARPQRQENGDTLWDGLMMDMTEFRRIEDQVRQLARFPSENPNPVLRVGACGDIVYANKAAEPLLALWSRTVGEKLPQPLLDMAMDIRSTGTHDCVEVPCRDRIYSIVFASIREADYVNIYARDVTEVKQAQLELIRANEVLREHDRLKSEFVSTVSHELRTPLCIFKNIVSNAMAGVMGKIPPKLYESLKTADQSIDRLSRIVADFLDISRIESGAMVLHPEAVSIQSLVSEVADSLRPLASAKRIELNTRMPRRALTVHVDRDRIVQVLTNLVGNAIKFIPANGTIEVEVADRQTEVQVLVRDNGPGLSREEMERIFDRFIQVHHIAGAGEHGTGLGLTIAKELVEMHNGRLWVESVLGSGCAFYFTLPVHDPAETPEETPEPAASRS